MSRVSVMGGLVAAMMAGSPARAAEAVPVENSFFVGDSCPAPDIHPEDSATYRGVDKPSSPRRSDAATLKAFLAALRTGKLAKARALGPGVFGPGASTRCLDGLRQLVAHCRSEPPYLLENGSIRVAWLCNRFVSYNSYFVVSDGRIRDLDGADVTEPLVAIPGEGGGPR